MTDAEDFQEILRWYAAIDRRDAIQPCFDILLDIVDEVLLVDIVAFQRALQIVLCTPELTARDAIHVAMMELHNIAEIATFDRHFDGLPGVVRLS